MKIESGTARFALRYGKENVAWVNIAHDRTQKAWLVDVVIPYANPYKAKTFKAKTWAEAYRRSLRTADRMVLQADKKAKARGDGDASIVELMDHLLARGKRARP